MSSLFLFLLTLIVVGYISTTIACVLVLQVLKRMERDYILLISPRTQEELDSIIQFESERMERRLQESVSPEEEQEMRDHLRRLLKQYESFYVRKKK